MDWPNFIEPENHIVSSLISRRLGTQETSGFIGLDDRVPDAFSEAYYSLESSEQQPTTLKISYTLWGSFDRPGILGQAKLEAQQRFKVVFQPYCPFS